MLGSIAKEETYKKEVVMMRPLHLCLCVGACTTYLPVSNFFCFDVLVKIGFLNVYGGSNKESGGGSNIEGAGGGKHY